jgi:murein DD-endopeptidase MepM/ murein hydrolase activator NlpD
MGQVVASFERFSAVGGVSPSELWGRGTCREGTVSFLRLACIALVGATAIAGGVACRPAAAEPPSTTQLKRFADIALAHDSEVFAALIPARSTLAAVLETHELLAHEVLAIVEGVGERFDLRKLRSGQAYRLDRFLDGRVREFELEIDRDRRVLVRRRDATDLSGFYVDVAAIPKTVQEVLVTGAITRETPSLVEALDQAGERIELSLALADIFGGEMDFNSDVQSGDTFRVLVERATRSDGGFAGYGPILAAEYVNEGRPFRAVRFTSPDDGKAAYYDANGQSLKRFFLKSPLKFEPRITSRFARARRHPILNFTRAQNGVDSAAPTGAPVAAVASGVVTSAGWSGGGGRMVRIRHASGYESEYLHLSAIARGISSGVRVAQGALIGRVGATGLATGPHLHYGLRKDGAYVNPVRAHQTLPPGEPIAPEHRALFELERDRMLFGRVAADLPLR